MFISIRYSALIEHLLRAQPGQFMVEEAGRDSDTGI